MKLIEILGCVLFSGASFVNLLLIALLLLSVTIGVIGLTFNNKTAAKGLVFQSKK